MYVYTYIHIQNNTCFSIFSTLETRNEMNERMLNNRLEVNVLFMSYKGGQNCWSRKRTEGKIRNDFDSSRGQKSKENMKRRELLSSQSLKGSVCTVLPSSPSFPPCNHSAGISLGCKATKRRVRFDSTTHTHIQTHKCSAKTRKVSKNKRLTVSVGAFEVVGGTQTLSAATGACQSSRSECHSQKQHIHARVHTDTCMHALNMEVGDQSSDGQVKDLCRSGNVNQERSFTVVCPLCS